MTKRDTATLPWASSIRNFGIGPFVWQPALNQIRGAELVVLGQENKLLLNYLLQLVPRRLRPRIALFGHGRNFQSRAPDGAAERWKRLWTTRCDWWFAYTHETRRHVASLGFPESKITVFNNSIDTNELRSLAEAVTPERLAARRTQLGIVGRHVGLYVGGLYPDKRLDFLIRAGDEVRKEVPEFELLIIGGGPSASQLAELAASRPWLKLLGPRFGPEKAELMALGHLFLIPGLVGLAVLDAGVMGLPLITTAFSWHSPEIAYLEDGENGIIVQDEHDEGAYAKAVSKLLLDSNQRRAMSQSSSQRALSFSIESMSEKFAGGVIEALSAESRNGRT